MWEKFISASKEYADPFYFKEKFRSASKKDADLFYLKKNQICIEERCGSILFEEK